MAGEAKFSATMDAEQVVRELTKLQTANARLQESLTKIKVESVATNNALGISYREATRLVKEFGDAGSKEVTRYKAELEGLRQSMLAGNLSQDEYRKTVQLSNQGHKERVALLKSEIAEQGRIKDVAKQALADQMTAADKTKVKVDDLTKAWKAGLLTTEQYAAAVKRAHAETAQLPGPLAAARSEIVGMVSGLAAGTLSIGAMVNAVKDAYAEAKTLREEHRVSQLTVAETQAEAVKMLGPVSLDESSAFLSRISDIGARTGMKDLAPLYQAAADTLSAVGGNANLTANILEGLIPLSKARPQELAPLAGAVGDLATILRAESPEEIKRVISTVIATVGQGRIVSLASMKEAAAAIAGATAVDTGTDRNRAVREASAAFAAIGGSIKDPEGALTKTATAELAVALARLLPEKDVQRALSAEEKTTLAGERDRLKGRIAALKAGTATVTEDQADEMAAIEKRQSEIETQLAPTKTGKPRRFKKGERERLEAEGESLARRRQTLVERASSGAERSATLAALEKELAEADQALQSGVSIQAGTGFQTFQQRLRAVQGSRELQLRFWEKQVQGKKPTFRGAIAPVVRTFLENGNSEIARRYDEATRVITDRPEDYEAMVRNIRESSPQLQLAEREAAGQSVITQHQQADVAGARRAQVERIVAQVLPEVSPGLLEAFGRRLFSWPQQGINKARGLTPEEQGIERLLAARAKLVPELNVEAIGDPLADLEAAMAAQQRPLDADRAAKLRTLDKTIDLLMRIGMATDRDRMTARATRYQRRTYPQLPARPVDWIADMGTPLIAVPQTVPTPTPAAPAAVPQTVPTPTPAAPAAVPQAVPTPQVIPTPAAAVPEQTVPRPSPTIPAAAAAVTGTRATIPAATAAGGQTHMQDLLQLQRENNATLARVAASNERMAQEQPPPPIGVTASAASGLGSQTQSR